MWLDVDGKRAYAYTGGKTLDPRRPAVVFVHGAQHDHSVWILQSRYLAHHGRAVLALDLPGHGRSEGAPLASVEAMGQWVLAAMRAAGIARAVIVGHSMGSLIALEAAGSAPEAVEGIAMVGSAYPMRVSDALLEAARDDEARAFAMINEWSHSGLTHPPGCPAPGFSVFIQNLRLMERQAPGVLLNDFNACNVYGGGEARAAQVRCPALFVLGARDMMTPPKAAATLVAALADASVVTVPDCGHALMAEQPDAVLEALRTFLERIDANRTAAAA